MATGDKLVTAAEVKAAFDTMASKADVNEVILAKDISFSNISVLATGSTYVAYDIPPIDNYSRVGFIIMSVSGSGTGNLILTIHGSSTSGNIYLSSGSGSAITANFVIRAFYVKAGFYKNVT